MDARRTRDLCGRSRGIYHLTSALGELFLLRAPLWMAPLGALLALVISISFVRWQMGRYLVRPLEAMAAAARQIAAGDLEFELPETRVREVGEVSAAFEAMAAGLRESIRRQSELEEQRRFFWARSPTTCARPVCAARLPHGAGAGITDHTRAERTRTSQCAARKPTSSTGLSPTCSCSSRPAI